MRWYRPVPCDKTVEKPTVCDTSYIEKYGYTKESFLTGELLNAWENKIFYAVTQKECDGEPDDVLQNVDMIPVFSLELISQIRDVGIGGFQFLPIMIVGFDSKIINGFHIANVVNFIEAFNYKFSDYSYWPKDFPNENIRGKLKPARKYVLNKKSLNGFDVIRLAEMKRAYFVSEKFKRLFETNEFTGYSFQEVQTV
jgi:hypothetical protein